MREAAVRSVRARVAARVGRAAGAAAAAVAWLAAAPVAAQTAGSRAAGTTDVPKAMSRTPSGAAWYGDELPLPLAVKTPEDLAFKGAAERQYLIFNLFAGGKVAWDRGDFEGAASRWETLLRTPGVPADIEAVTKPLAAEARRRAGGAAAAVPLVPPLPIPAAVPAPGGAGGGSRASGGSAAAKKPAAPVFGSVTGSVSGGGAMGPGGTVLMLRRAEGGTPRPKPGTNKFVVQKGKSFVPRVLAVPIGTRVEFRNEDDIFHNVFSLTRPNDFDLGLYKGGLTKEVEFGNSPGPVQLLCNIHSGMVGYLYLVDTPWFAQADGSGGYAIKNVPPGDYVLEAWHESASSTAKQVLSVGEGENVGMNLTVGGDKSTPAFVPDKYGKPRQPQLGY